MDTNERARILIHELGHAFNFLIGSGGSKFVSEVRLDGSVDMALEKDNALRERKCIP